MNGLVGINLRLRTVSVIIVTYNESKYRFYNFFLQLDVKEQGNIFLQFFVINHNLYCRPIYHCLNKS